MAQYDVIVIGAGVVGLTCAIEHVFRGRSVALVDKGEPGQGCSYGNAGIIAASEVFPVVSPTRLLGLPHMLFSTDGPAAIRPTALPSLMPWFAKAALSLHPARQRAIISALAALNGRAVASWRDLLGRAGSAALMYERGMLRLVRNEADYNALKKINHIYSDMSLTCRMVNREEVLDLEPGLGRHVIGGLFHYTDAHISDPYDLSLALLDYLKMRGVAVVTDNVTAIYPMETGAKVEMANGSIAGDQVVIAAGLHSAALMSPLGIRAPLQAERGYHLMLRQGGTELNRPVTFHAESCVATPMKSQLRLAGTVEFARETTSANWHRADRLKPIAERYLGSRLESDGAVRWLGSRPSLPDSLPAIGLIPSAPQIGYAFGHQHLGLTQAAISARLLAQLLNHENPDLDCRPYDARRFG